MRLYTRESEGDLVLVVMIVMERHEECWMCQVGYTVQHEHGV